MGGCACESRDVLVCEGGDMMDNNICFFWDFWRKGTVPQDFKLLLITVFKNIFAYPCRIFLRKSHTVPCSKNPFHASMFIGTSTSKSILCLLLKIKFC